MEEILQAAAAHWNLPWLRQRPDVPMPGSPERCRLRLVVQAEDQLFVLEKLLPDAAPRRRRLALILTELAARGVPWIAPPRPSGEGAHLLDRDGAWQLTPFVPGEPLSRPDYVLDRAKGESLGLFLAALAEHGPSLEEAEAEESEAGSEDAKPGCETAPTIEAGSETPFSLAAYVDGLLARLRRSQPELAGRLAPVRRGLAAFLERCDQLPGRFCHGDFHPLNVVWGREGPRAVIDWEFAGWRPALWDAALCVGCVGIEAPLGLVEGLVPAMLGVLRTRGWLEASGRGMLVELVLAQRFAWLAEWLRRQDRDMIRLELDYMDLVMANAGRLRRAWEE